VGKIGRNERCPCGSGKRFKHCHGIIGVTASMPLALEPSNADLQAVIQRHQALQFQRERQQGRGRPIISAELNGVRFVAIGNQIAYGKWQTFQDFLLHHIRARFGWEWGQAQQAKPESEQHPFVRWLKVLSGLMESHTTNHSGMNSMPEYGAARAVLGLAYDLYVIEHHAKDDADRRAHERLLARLRHPDQFLGARHEARAAGILLRAGFDLTWEDEQSRREGGHGEFVATFPQTGRSFWVECKMRQPEDDEGTAKFTHLVSAALQKETELERLVFVELNLPNGRMDPHEGGWPGWAINQLRTLEGQPNAAGLPPALVLISNFPEHRHLEGLLEGAGALLEGFKTGDGYRTELVNLLDAIEEREKNIEIESLWRSMREHSFVPTTFDGSIPALDESQRLLIGQFYEMDNGEVGVLEEATVVEQWRQAAGVLRLPDGKRVIYQFDLSDEELHAWRRHPETFFGEFRPHHPEAKNSMDLYEFFAKAYAETPRERLLEFMAGHPDIEELRKSPQGDLVKQYAYRLTAAVAGRNEPPAASAWHRRLRRRKKPDGGGA